MEYHLFLRIIFAASSGGKVSGVSGALGLEVLDKAATTPIMMTRITAAMALLVI